MELIKYVKRKGQRVGVVVSNERNSVGWSLCNVSKGDKFDKKKALEIARGRERALVNPLEKVCSSMRSPVEDMVERSRRYFK